ncbi:MAG: hypothetical protein JO169_07975, partial [Solirubrobacterales bacterium]|nr:hypothetical protein [Solirubrobacterales bacterium]
MIPLAALAAGSFTAGILWATAPGRAERQLVQDYVTAWARNDYPRMYDLLDAPSRRATSEAQFAAELKVAAATATLQALIPGRIGARTRDVIPVRVRVRTELWGTLVATLRVPLAGSGSGASIRFSTTLLFPGLLTGEQLTRQVTLPPRAALLASDGAPLAEGAERHSSIPDVAGEIVGALGPIPADLSSEYAALGYPSDAKIGLDGLERVFQTRLAGRPGGTLLAGSRVLAQAPPIPAHAVTTTISPV